MCRKGNVFPQTLRFGLPERSLSPEDENRIRGGHGSLIIDPLSFYQNEPERNMVLFYQGARFSYVQVMTEPFMLSAHSPKACKAALNMTEPFMFRNIRKTIIACKAALMRMKPHSNG